MSFLFGGLGPVAPLGQVPPPAAELLLAVPPALEIPPAPALAPPILVPSLEKTLGLSALPASPCLLSLPLPPLDFSLSPPFSLPPLPFLSLLFPSTPILRLPTLEDIFNTIT